MNNVVSYSASVTQSMFAVSLYTGGWAVAVKPWNIQVQVQDAAGVWHLTYSSGGFAHKADAVAAAERMGIELSGVGWHADSVQHYDLGLIAEETANQVFTVESRRYFEQMLGRYAASPASL